MILQFLSPKHHGILDYLAAAGLIIFPFLLGLGSDGLVALLLSVTGGIGLITYSLLTDYKFGAFKLFSYDLHLFLDLSAAAAFITAPFAFGFETLTSIYYFVMAAGVIAVVAVSKRVPTANLADNMASSSVNTPQAAVTTPPETDIPSV